MSTASLGKNAVGSFRDVVQDLLVPEFKALKVSVESVHSEVGHLRSEMKVSLDSLRQETKISLDAFRQEMRISLESLRQEIKLRDEMNAQNMRNLSEKLDLAIDIRERLASLEARLPHQ